MKRFFFILLFFIMGTWPACSFKKAVLFPPTRPAKVPIEDVYVVLVLIDGGRPQEVDSLVGEGKLPTFKELFYDRGARFKDAISVIPTVSTPAHQAFISGLLPGHHGVPNLDWFSRPLAKHIDYLKPQQVSLTSTYMFNFNQVLQGEIKTDEPQLIYHALAGHPTMTVFETATSGVTLRLPAHPPFLTIYHTKVEKFYERMDLQAMEIALEKFQKLPAEQLPRFTYISFYGMDLVTHFHGPPSQRVADLYLQYDRFLRELKEILQNRGIWEKTTLIVLSDHGQHELNKVTDLKKIIQKIGLNYNPADPRAGQAMYGDHGTALSNLYFKIGDDWKQRPSYEDLQNYPLTAQRKINLIESFLQEPDIEFVLAPEGPWRTHIHRKGQHAVIERKFERGQMLYRYQVDPGQDPLGYLEDPVIRSWVQEKKFQNAQSWLVQTHDKTIPDGMILLSQIFDDYRMGEMVILTVKDSQFKEKRLSGHGSIYAEDLRILLMLHGPSIKPGLYPTIRSIDLYPTLLTLYGLRPSSPMDGVARREIFSDLKGFAADSDLEEETLQPHFVLGAQAFEEKLKEKLADSNLSEVEREKAIQMIYSLDQFLADHHE